MSYDIHLTIAEDSSCGHYIASLAAQQHISPTQAVERIIDHAAQRDTALSLENGQEETPGELVARLRAQKTARGEGPQAPMRLDNPERVIGLFAESPEVVESILNVVVSRSDRYMSGA